MARDRKTFPIKLIGEITVETAKSYKFWPIKGDDDFFVWVPKSNIDEAKSKVRPNSGKDDSELFVTEWWYGVSGIAERKRGEPPPAPRETTTNNIRRGRPVGDKDDDDIPF